MKDAPATSPKLHLAFDVGHSSIGWATLEESAEGRDHFPNVAGCGVVVFQADDCLAIQRRDYRRQRRRIRATRHRIERLKRLLVHMGVLSRADMDKPGIAWTWMLAARVLRGGKLLSWPELCASVLRWYAHNRGYCPFVGGDREEAPEDTEKVTNARALMQSHDTNTMAETICAAVGVDPMGTVRASRVRFKGVLNAAFPREIVEAEVGCILRAHFGKLTGVAEKFATALFSDWHAIPCPDLILPERYEGGLLFGQLKMRFDNRLISICPVTGQKVPLRNTPEFRRYRWAMQLAGVRVGDAEDSMRALSAPERQQVDARMVAQGAMTAGEFKKAVRETAACSRDNLDTMLMHPDAEKALVLDPLRKLILSDRLAPVWNCLPAAVQARARGRLRRLRKRCSWGWLREQIATEPERLAVFEAAVDATLATPKRKGSKKPDLTREELLLKRVSLSPEGGRAPYARPILIRAAEEAMAGKDPRSEGGCLFVTEQMRQEQRDRELAKQTNNHLVRHRLLILQRLARDMVKEYADNDFSRVVRITIEVNRDLREMSGKTTKERAQEIGLRLADFKHAQAYAEKELADRPNLITAGLLRKIRIAQDMDWRCPYTEQKYDIGNILSGDVDKDHIVPRSDRSTDALDSLILTFKAVNQMKGRRTALKFVLDEGGKQVKGMPQLSITTRQRYETLVKNLDIRKGHTDDQRRKERRKRLMLLSTYEEKEFLPRDLTVTSQLVRLGAQRLDHLFANAKQPPRIVSLPGSVTGAARRSWSLLGCLRDANPQVIDTDGELKTKTEIRDITHLHHALDACVLGLVAGVVPLDGGVWKAMIKRRPSGDEARLLVASGAFARTAEGRFELRDVPETLRRTIAARLSEKRVVQHIPVNMNGLPVKETVYRVVDFDDPSSSARRLCRFFTAQELPPLRATDDSAYVVHWVRKEKPNQAPKKCLHETECYWLAWDEVARNKLVGLIPGKLQRLKAVKIIEDNYGLALDPTPTVIPFHKVWHQLKVLREKNGGKPPRVLRNGQLIRVKSGRYFGIWRVMSLKNNEAGLCLKLGAPDMPHETHQNVLLRSLFRDGMTVLKSRLVGVPMNL